MPSSFHWVNGRAHSDTKEKYISSFASRKKKGCTLYKTFELATENDGLEWAVKFPRKRAKCINLEAIKFQDPPEDLAELIVISFYRAPNARSGSSLEQ